MILESEKPQIYEQMEARGGYKTFGELNHKVQKDPFTRELVLTGGTPKLSVIIPVIEREERFNETMGRLIKSAESARIGTQFIVVDNSLNRVVHGSVLQLPKDQSFITSVIYHHDPRLTFPTARNKAFQLAEGEFIASWDSDIYCSSRTLRELFKVWDENIHLSGLASPLGHYEGGGHRSGNLRISRYPDRQSFA